MIKESDEGGLYEEGAPRKEVSVRKRVLRKGGFRRKGVCVRVFVRERRSV